MTIKCPVDAEIAGFVQLVYKWADENRFPEIDACAVRKKMEQTNFTNVATCRAGSADCIFALRDGKVWAFIAGTNEFADVVADVNALPSEHNGVIYHSGTLELAKNVAQALNDYRPLGVHEYRIGGHSLGGGVCVPLVMLLPATASGSIVTFGAHRTIYNSTSFNRHRALTDQKWYFRQYVLPGDPIPTLPARLGWLRLGKCHPGAFHRAPITYVLANGQTLTEDEGTGTRLYTHARKARWLFGLAGAIQQFHGIENYHEALIRLKRGV